MNIVMGFVGGKSDFLATVQKNLEAENLKIDNIEQKFSKKEVESFMLENKEKYHVLIINENLEPDNPYREKEIERLSAALENVKIILIVSRKRQGTEYMTNLYNNGFYNALFDSDSSMKNIATIIKGGRSRRVAMAYYGIGTMETNSAKQPEVMTVGMALDMVNALPSYEEKVEFLKKALSELGEVQFQVLSKSLSNEVRIAAERERVLSPYFTGRDEPESESGVSFKEIKNDVIAVIDESGDGKRSAKLSYMLALGLASTTKVKPSFVQLPYKADAFDVLNFSEDFKRDFLSHLQVVMNGLPFSSVENMIDGVSVVCPNPATDILDDWSVLHSYKVMFQTAHPAVLDVGNTVNNRDVSEVLSDVSLWVVVVPSDVPVGGYLTDLKNRIGKKIEHPIIAITNRESCIVQNENYTEFGFPLLYSGEVDYPVNARKEFHALISLTPYGEGMVSEVAIEKKKVVKPSKFVPEKKQGTTEISICGSGHGSGCTYSVVAMASILAKYYRVAVVECNESYDMECLGANTKSRKFSVGNVEMFKYKGVDFFYKCTQSHFRATFKGEYDFVIYDCGLEVESDEFQSVDIRIVSVSGSLWRMDEVDLLARRLDLFDTKRKVICFVSGQRTSDLKAYRVLCHKRAFYGIPLSYSPFEQGTDFVSIISRIVGLPLN